MNPSSAAPDPTPPADQAIARWFAEEVQPHEAALKSWLRARFPWLLDVDDVAQESIFRLWRRQARTAGAPLRSPKAALFAIARNAAVDAARREAVVGMVSMPDMERLPVMDKTDVAEAVSVRQELDFLAEAVRGLPARCRQVVTLTKIYGYSEREVAERLGISENTVRTQVVRGMERCTEYLRRRGVSRKQP
jgi:RNA polymerase sigma-70 factor (ECF subfamily)